MQVIAEPIIEIASECSFRYSHYSSDLDLGDRNFFSKSIVMVLLKIVVITFYFFTYFHYPILIAVKSRNLLDKGIWGIKTAYMMGIFRSRLYLFSKQIKLLITALMCRESYDFVACFELASLTCFSSFRTFFRLFSSVLLFLIL